MKTGLMLVLLLVSQLSFAQTLKEKKTREEMLSRVATLTLKIDEARFALDKEDVGEACTKINELFKLMPDHLVSIGTKMDLFDGTVIRMENESKMHLIYLHQQSNVCASGDVIGENIDMGEVSRKLKSMKKALEKQKKKIRKADLDYNNTYNYYYEFN